MLEPAVDFRLVQNQGLCDALQRGCLELLNLCVRSFRSVRRDVDGGRRGRAKDQDENQDKPRESEPTQNATGKQKEAGGRPIRLVRRQWRVRSAHNRRCHTAAGEDDAAAITFLAAVLPETALWTNRMGHPIPAVRTQVLFHIGLLPSTGEVIVQSGCHDVSADVVINLPSGGPSPYALAQLMIGHDALVLYDPGRKGQAKPEITAA